MKDLLLDRTVPKRLVVQADLQIEMKKYIILMICNNLTEKFLKEINFAFEF